MTYAAAVLADSPLHFWQLQEQVTAPSVVQFASYTPTSNTTSHNISLAGAPAAGHYLILVIHDVGSSNIPTPGGAAWTQHASLNLGASLGWLYAYGRAVSGDGATINVTFSINTVPQMFLYDLANVDLTAPVGDTSNTNSGLVPLPLQPTREKALIIYAGVGLGTATLAPPAGWTTSASIGTTGPLTLASAMAAYVVHSNPDTTEAVGSTVTSGSLTGGIGSTSLSINGALAAAADTGSGVNAPGTQRTTNDDNAQIQLGLPGPERTDFGMRVDIGSASITYMEVPDQADLDIIGDLTIEAWMRREASSQPFYILAKGAATGGNIPYVLSVTSAGTPSFYGSNGASSGTARTGTAGSVPTGSWVHLAVTRSGTTLTFYVNGVSQAASGAATAPAANALSAVIGSLSPASGSGTAPGVLAYVAIWASALTGTQVANHYAGRVVTGPRITQAELQVLAQGDSLGRVTQAQLQVLAQGTARARISQAPLQVLTNPPVGITTYRDLVLATTGLVGYWPLNDAGSPVQDLSVNANHCTASGTWIYQYTYMGPDNRASARCSGTNASLEDASVSGLPTGNNNWSFEAWMQLPAATSGVVPIMTIGDANVSEPQLSYNPANGRLYYFGGTSFISGVPDTRGPRFHHFVSTWDGTDIIFYVDGVSVGSTAFLSFDVVYTTFGVRLARTHNNGNSPGPVYQDMALYNVPLSAATVLAHYEAGLTEVAVVIPPPASAGGNRAFIIG